ncbi:response regulator [Pseudooceanicola sp. CBS1P-1]|nr:MULTISPECIES: ATP-binding protein [Pseudooceanicola]MBT9383998.1 response regulator [Pseudooceanicola endophyticus]
MPFRNDQTLRRAWIRSQVAAMVLAACAIVAVGMGWALLKEIDAVSSPRSDGALWSLARIDAEYGKLYHAVEHGSSDPDTLNQLRQRFDIFYSAVQVLLEGEVFRDMIRTDPDYADSIHAISDQLEQMIPTIDASDAVLGAQVDRLTRIVGGMAPQVRDVLLNGRNNLTHAGDQIRRTLTRGLVLMGLLLLAFVVGLGMLAYALSRLARDAALKTRQVRAHALRMQTIIETSRDAVVVCDDAAHILEFNASAERIFGLKRNDVLGRRAPELLFAPEDSQKILAMGRRYREGRLPPTPAERLIEVTAQDSTGHHFPAEFSFARAADEDGGYYVAFISDISRRRSAEELLTAARDRAVAGQRAKSEFLAMMSHEMRTPLNGLLGTLQLLEEERLSAWQRALTDRMRTSGRLLLGLVNDVLDLEKFEAGKMTAEVRPFSIPRLLDGVIDTMLPLANANGNQLSWTWVGSPAETGEGDPRRLRQVLLNLVGNAVKFTRNGRVTLEAEILGGGQEVEFRVIDTGIGIRQEDLDRIFEDFETLDSSYARQSGGSGLGLGITRRLISLMGGQIGAESEPGEGSLFWIRLALSPSKEQTAPKAKAETTPEELPPLDLLLVEDNEINRFVAREMLGAAGHRVSEATNGQIGVDMALEHRYDAILMDISMPVMDGPEAARQIRKSGGPNAIVPIIAVTAHALPEELERFQAAGMKHCVHKPIDREELMRTLAEALRPMAPVVTQLPDAEEGPDRAPLVDTSQLETLRANLAPKIHEGLLSRFLNETAEQLAHLRRLELTSPEIAPLAHRLAGSCGTFGLIALRDALDMLETRLKRGETLYPFDIERIMSLWQDSRHELTAACPRAPAAQDTA